MRLHRLTLQAIGPYAGEHTIDFVELGRAGLFLLEGPTGAGKSTIIDAIVFGLYGELAGTGASKDRLHSHHAQPGTEPFVELVFETGSGVYRVRRTPAYQRPKQRGAGFTPQQASATLVRLTDPDALAGETLSTRAQEIGPEISRIVGLTREQFVQTIVLPQGEFAKFLAAGGEERSELLRSLFGTEHYERVAKHLVEQRRQAQRDIEGAREALGRAIARFAGAAELDDARELVAGRGADTPAGMDAPAAVDAESRDPATGDPSAAEPDPDPDVATLAVALEPDSEDLVGDATRIVAVLERHAAVDASTAAEVRVALERARAEHAAAQTLLASIERRAELLTERELLSVDDEPVARLSERIAAAARADTVASALAGAATASAALEDAIASLAAMEEQTDEAIVALDDASVAARRESLTVERASMAAVLVLEAADADRERALTALTEELATVDERLAELAAEQTRRDARRAALSSAPERASRAATESARAARSVERVAERRAVLDRVEATDERLVGLTDEVTEAATAAKAAIEAETSLRLRRIEGMAGELATGLREGEPCSVCGSLSHPAPAVLDGDHPDADAVEAASVARADAEATMQSAQSARDVARAERRRLVEQFLALADEASGVAAVGSTDASTTATAGFDPVTARAAVDAAAADAERQHAEAVVIAAEADAEVVEAGRLADEHLSGVVAVSERTATRATLTERLAAAQRVHERARAEVAGVLDGRAASLAELDAMLEAELSSLSLLAAARATVADRRQRDAERAVELEAALERAGFADRAAAEAAAMNGVERASAEARVADHLRHTTANAEALASPALAGVAGTAAPDVEATARRLADAEAAAGTATAAAAVSARRATNAAAACTALAEAADENADAVREAAAVVRLADVVSATGSENSTKVTLGTYVLLRRFEDVVAAANARLESMSGGRYELVRSDVKEGPSRSQRVGLSLTVHDHRTDRRRDPKSLSGGETFYASLCLALGLADVVTGEAGGVELGTLFVDEGFGSLDPETLDTVMAELGRLSAGGRVVGVVSHVEEMKQRIGERIEVRRLEDGSSTLLVRA
ncbi:exonuclease SbcC [Plantibacter flavus]|uniref:Nuclease SbcCD subunit C n=1 Tax=Plantibacter flavus TaxID=150123 RepID=A0A3N2BXZ0_9MICO|nr:AAA family ATPase [Plantibacter flavus]ROR80141.1 exonuclease SbcC [Plantibacter flavus]SMG50760.1 exonuclease SbcC [Plantibacter flavus]